MNTQRAFFALMSALVVAASPTASAVIYNLEATPTILVDTTSGPIYFSADFTSSGTGNFDPFLSIQNSPFESGYNIDQGVLDTKRNGQFTLTQRVSDLQTVTIGGVEYYSFLIDINESTVIGRSRISLDSLAVFTSSTLHTTPQDLTANAVLQISLDSLGDNTLLYNDRNSGSGEGDIAFIFQKSVLADAAPTDFFYLFEEFGGFGGLYESEAGFEETRHAPDITFVPIPETNGLMPILAVLGVVVAGPFVRRCFHP